MLEVERVHRLRAGSTVTVAVPPSRSTSIGISATTLTRRLAPQEVDDLGSGAPGVKISATPCSLSATTSSLRDRAADDDEHVLRAVLAQAVEDPRDERHVRAGEDRDPDGVRVLLDRRLDDLLRRLVEARVDDLHARRRAGRAR